MEFNNDKYENVLDFIKKNKKNTQIVAISKYYPQESVIKALKFGVRIFGENRVQEAESKFFELKSKYNDIEIHLTGPLQTNKVKKALEIFDFIQTLDRKKLADEFCKHQHLLKNKKFLIQINTGKESAKSGIFPESADEFISYCQIDLKLNIVGLMCIPPISDNPIKHFNILKEIANKNNLSHLSMGMTDDYEEAIKEGATYIRLGRLLFGAR